MIDLVDGIILLIVGFIGGAALHSLWGHAVKRGELKDWWKIIRKKKAEMGNKP